MCCIKVPINADDSDSLHREIERACVPVRLLEQVLDRHEQLSGKQPERAIELLDHAVSQRVPLNLLDAFPEALRRIIKMVQDNVLEPKSSELRDCLEGGGVERDVRNERQRRVALQQSGDGSHVQRAVG